jgi:hypothetical protein
MACRDGGIIIEATSTMKSIFPALFLLASFVCPAAAVERPNVIVILADDK